MVDRISHQDVVEVRDHKIRAAELPIERCGGEHDAGKAAMRNWNRSAAQDSIGTVKWILPEAANQFTDKGVRRDQAFSLQFAEWHMDGPAILPDKAETIEG